MGAAPRASRGEGDSWYGARPLGGADADAITDACDRSRGRRVLSRFARRRRSARGHVVVGELASIGYVSRSHARASERMARQVPAGRPPPRSPARDAPRATRSTSRSRGGFAEGRGATPPAGDVLMMLQARLAGSPPSGAVCAPRASGQAFWGAASRSAAGEDVRPRSGSWSKARSHAPRREPRPRESEQSSDKT